MVSATSQKTWRPSSINSAPPTNLPRKICAGTFIKPLNGSQAAIAGNHDGKNDKGTYLPEKKSAIVVAKLPTARASRIQKAPMLKRKQYTIPRITTHLKPAA